MQIKSANAEEYAARKQLKLVRPYSGEWQEALPSSFVELRLSAAVRDEWSAGCVCTPFPGDVIPGPGDPAQSKPVYRGSLMYERYLRRGNLQGQATNFRRRGGESRVASMLPLMSRPVAMSAGALRELLSDVHDSWMPGGNVDYKPASVSMARSWLQLYRSRLKPSSIVPLLFELESFAFHWSFTGELQLLASGFYDGYWLEIFAVPLAELRPSEVCIKERVVEEFFRLQSQGFAPLAINEYHCVVDGNHRLLAFWLWNILHAASAGGLHLSDLELRNRALEYVQGQQLSSLLRGALQEPVSCLLDVLCSSAELFANYGRSLDSNTRGAIQRVPVIFVPEYSAGAVVKQRYEAGILEALSAETYAHLVSTDNELLPARYPYHFTDVVMLPEVKLVYRATEDG